MNVVRLYVRVWFPVRDSSRFTTPWRTVSSTERDKIYFGRDRSLTTQAKMHKAPLARSFTNPALEISCSLLVGATLNRSWLCTRGGGVPTGVPCPREATKLALSLALPTCFASDYFVVTRERVAGAATSCAPLTVLKKLSQ